MEQLLGLQSADALFDALDRNRDGVLSRSEFIKGVGVNVAVEASPQIRGCVPIPQSATDWGWLEHLLQASCQTSRLRLRAAWSIRSPRLAVEAEQRCRGLQRLHAWVPVAELPPGQPSVEEICQNGFRAGHLGISFHIGNMRLPNLLQDGRRGRMLRRRGGALPQGRHLYEFLLCKVGVGRAYVVESAEDAENMELPQEYDSFFVKHEAPTGDASLRDEDLPGVLPRHMLHHEYIVRDPAQALPVYLIHSEYDPEAQEKLALPLCDNCGMKAALVYCRADQAALCQPCDVKIHSINSIASRHIRVDVNRRPGNSPGCCPEHEGVEPDQYCLECRQPICPQCLSVGSHSSGEFAQHRRIDLREAYENAITTERPKTRSAIPDRQEFERLHVGELDRRLMLVKESGQAAEDAIYERVQEAVRQAHALAMQQATLFFADELEAKRQLEAGAWMERFLEDHVKALPPAEFLGAWLKHCRVREEMASMGALGCPRANPGLRVEGSLRLRREDALQGGHRSSQSWMAP